MGVGNKSERFLDLNQGNASQIFFHNSQINCDAHNLQEGAAVTFGGRYNKRTTTRTYFN
jgi:cold shock CspA family protein